MFFAQKSKVGIACAMLLLVSAMVNAANQTVTNLNDSGAGSLRQAVTDVGTGESINFSSGLSGSIVLSTGQITIAKSMTIDATGAIITVDGNASSRIFYISDNANTLNITISNLTITNGRAFTADSNENAGAIYNRGENLTFNNCTISNSVVVGDSSSSGSRTGYGGGIRSDTTSGNGTLTMNNCTISGNTAMGIKEGTYEAHGQGGGIWSNCPTTLSNCLIDNNQATRTGGTLTPFGGGIYLTSNTLSMTSCTVSNNTGGHQGGGICLNTVIGAHSISKSDVNGNTSTYANGGGLYFSGNAGSSLQVSDSSFYNNLASSNGGGLYFSNAVSSVVTVVLQRSAIYSNRLETASATGNLYGGGISAYCQNTGTLYLTLKNCTVTGNTLSKTVTGAGTVNGGAIYLARQNNTANMDFYAYNSTITSNDATSVDAANGRTGGISSQAGFVTLVSTIVADNTDSTTEATYGPDIFRGNLSLMSNGVSSVTIDDGGSGYGTAPTIGFSGGGGTNAAGTAVLTDGAVTAINMTNYGYGYTSAPTVTFVGGGGSGALATANVTSSTEEYNLIETATGGHGIKNGINNNIVGSDPALNPLADNGGLSKTQSLQVTSPAINAGSNPMSLTTDQRGSGFVRTFGAGTDIGAFELQSKNWDLNGDGKSDVVADDSATYYGYLYLMNGATPSASDNIYRNTNPDWSVAGVADFNGDFKADLIWESASTGKSMIYLMNGFTVVSVGTIYNGGTGWKLDKLGDFNGDGKCDILWKHPVTGQGAIYIMNGTSVSDSSSIARKLDWEAKSTGDFNGDGKADILWEIANKNGILYLMDGKNISIQGDVYLRSGNWIPEFFADFNGDGKCDMLWRDTVANSGYMYLMNGLSVDSQGYIYTTPPASAGWSVIQSGDFNADGKSDLLWQNSLTGLGSIWLMNGLTMLSSGMPYTVKNPDWQVLRLLDFNGDNKADIIWQNTSTLKAIDYIMNGVSIQATGTVFSNSTRTVIDPFLNQ